MASCIDDDLESEQGCGHFPHDCSKSYRCPSYSFKCPRSDIASHVASTTHKFVVPPATPNMPSRAPRQPKLRSSCDSCGAAKLKCDRDRPHCGRCRLRGQTCVYGVSRKMGKPPRDKLKFPVRPSRPRTQAKCAGSIERERCDGLSLYSRTSSTSTCFGDGGFANSEPCTTINQLPSAWGEGHDYFNGFAKSVLAPEIFRSDLLGPSDLDFMTPNFDDAMQYVKVDNLPISRPGSPGPKGYSTSAARARLCQTQADRLCLDSAYDPLAESKGHDCSGEAYDILRSLSSPRTKNMGCAPGSASPSASTRAITAVRVPFAHILRLNQEAGQRIGRLLACSCATYPHLALLYASIISTVLNRYQQAAGSTERATWNPAMAPADGALHYMSPSSSVSGSRPPWSSTPVSGTSTPALTETETLTLAPTHLAAVPFDKDEQQVQTALKFQLLSDGMRRTGSLIDLFASRGSSDVDAFTLIRVESLYASLSSWLRREHSIITDIIRSRLREANACIRVSHQ